MVHSLEDQQQIEYNKALTLAKTRLSKQRDITGVSILGRPPCELDSDPKYQGELKSASIKVGEELALAALSAEFLILNVENSNLDFIYKNYSKYHIKNVYFDAIICVFVIRKFCTLLPPCDTISFSNSFLLLIPVFIT